MIPMALRIRRARVLANLSQAELAQRAGVKRSAVTQWEREGGTHPSLEHLTLIAVATHVPFEWLATGRGEAGNHPVFEVPAASGQVLDEVEARVLVLLRRMPVRKRQAICALLEMLV
ncbi:helix-turn-helix domain-containing protein [Pseudoxanthomonas sp. 22568]|jgi:transcriptional regulator with XRE-family HTH domain|uniref:helix-turn-helix domain-containing protein n=1 Tax=Pseudoxanthomonas sp. 22568 TaxID=3453945 RepID=UPI003F82DFCD